MNELYLDDQGRAAGPYPIDQVREMVQTNTLTLDSKGSLRPEGPWFTLRELLAQTNKTLPHPRSDRQSTALTFERAINFIPFLLDYVVGGCIFPFRQGDQTARVYGTYQTIVCWTGQASLLVSGLLFLMVTGILAIKANSALPLPYGIAGILFVILGFYVSVKFAKANNDLLRADTIYLNSDAITSTSAVFFLLFSLAIIAFGTIGAIIAATFNLLGAIILFLGLLYSAIISFHLVILSKECSALLQVDTQPKDVSAGQVFLGIFKFFARLNMAVSFIVVGLSGCASVLYLLIGALFLMVNAASSGGSRGYNSFGGYRADNPFAGLSELPEMAQGLTTITSGVYFAFVAALTPLFAYFSYLLVAFFVDLMTAVIRTANNTDRIK